MATIRVENAKRDLAKANEDALKIKKNLKEKQVKSKRKIGDQQSQHLIPTVVNIEEVFI